MHAQTYFDAFIDVDKTGYSPQQLIFQLKNASVRKANVCSSNDEVLMALQNCKDIDFCPIKKILMPSEIDERYDKFYLTNLHDFSPQQLDEIVLKLGKREVFIEFARSLSEVGQIDKSYNLAPSRFLEEFGFLDHNATLIGCNHLEKDDLQTLALLGVKIILTPIFDMRNGLGVINLYQLMSAEIDFTVASGGEKEINLRQEAILAMGNTANLMYSDKIYSQCDLLEKILNN